MSSSSSACLLVAGKSNNMMSMLKQQPRIKKKIKRFQLLTCTLTGPCRGQLGAGHTGKSAHALHTFLHVLILQLLQLCQQLVLTDHSRCAGLHICTMNIILKYKWLLPHRRRRQKVWKWHHWSLGPCPAAPLYPASCHLSCQCCFKKKKKGGG